MNIPTDIEHTFSEYIDMDFEFTEDDIDDIEQIVYQIIDDQMGDIKSKCRELVEDFKEELRNDPELREEYGIEDD